MLREIPGDVTKAELLELRSMWWLFMTQVGGQVMWPPSSQSKTGRLEKFDLDILTSLPLNSAIFFPFFHLFLSFPILGVYWFNIF